MTERVSSMLQLTAASPPTHKWKEPLLLWTVISQSKNNIFGGRQRTVAQTVK